MENKGLNIEIEGGGLLIEVGQSRFEEIFIPYQKFIHIFLFIICRESHYFEDIVNL